MAKYEKPNRATFDIEFETPVTEMTIGGVPQQTKKISIAKIIDNPATKTVAVMTRKNRLFVLWAGDAYDAIGNWTNEQVTERVKELAIAGQIGE